MNFKREEGGKYKEHSGHNREKLLYRSQQTPNTTGTGVQKQETFKVMIPSHENKLSSEN